MRFEYPERFRLEIDEFHLEAGEKVAVVGQNGSGKSTLLRILAFLEEPSSWDTFSYAGEEFVPGRMKRDSIGLLRQQPWLFRESVASNLEFGLRARGRSKREIEHKVTAICERLGLKGYVSSPARRLSGGEQKRLALGRVLITEPELLLLDEPMAHLDRNSQTIIENLIAETEATVLFTTHEMRTALKLADRTINLKDGKISQDLPVNVFEGSCDGDRLITDRGLEIYLPEPATAEKAKCAVDPTAIAISLEPFPSSIRNALPGNIQAIHAHGEEVWLEIAGAEILTAVISRSSYEALGLNLHRDVIALFKATSVQIL